MVLSADSDISPSLSRRKARSLEIDVDVIFWPLRIEISGIKSLTSYKDCSFTSKPKKKEHIILITSNTSFSR